MESIEEPSVTIGKAFHLLMEFSMDLANVDSFRAKKLISEFALSSSDEVLILDSIIKIRNSKACIKLLNSGSAFVLIESEWQKRSGRILRPDRVDFNLDEKTANIIDFKWRFNEERKISYISQLRQYTKVMEFHYPEIAVKSFLVSGEAQISYVQGDQLVQLN